MLFKWFFSTFIGCFIIGLVTRFPAKAIDIYGIHCLFAALFMTFFLYLMYERGKHLSPIIKIIPILVFGAILGMMSPIMAIYNVNAAFIAMIVGFVVHNKKKEAVVMSVSYATACYPCCLIAALIMKSPVSLNWTCLLITIAGFVLSLIGIFIENYFFSRFPNFVATTAS